MTVLRSREVLPAAASEKQSLPPATENMVLEPATPCKAFESFTQSMDGTTPNSTPDSEKCGDLGSDTGSEGGSAVVIEIDGQKICRSARLASKMGVKVCGGNADTARGGKKRKVVGSVLKGECDVQNLVGGSYISGGNGGNLQNLDDGETTKLSTDLEGTRKSVAMLGLDHETETPFLENVSNGRCKRKLSMEDKPCDFIESCENGEVEKGKRVANGIMKSHNGSANEMGCDEDKNTSNIFSNDGLKATSLEASKVEPENCNLPEDGFSREEKTKAKGKCKLNWEAPVMKDYVPVILPESSKSSNVPINNEDGTMTEMGVRTRGRMNKEEKGKMKLGNQDSSSQISSTANPKSNHIELGSSSGTSSSAANENLQDRVQEREADVTTNGRRRGYMERHRIVARRIASRFAHFSSRDEFGNQPGQNEASLPETEDAAEDWPGPFSTAMKIIKDRGTNKQGDRRGSSSEKKEAIEVKWTPKKQESVRCQKLAPSLQELCLPILSQNADAISSLEFVPDVLRHKICSYLCDGGRMDSHFLKLLVQDSPTEIRLRNCSWLSEEFFATTFGGCDTSKLAVLQLDLCGNCMPDYALYGTLCRSPNNLSALTMISLRGAYRLSDTGLSTLVSSAPSLKSIDISQCPMLTAEGICCLVNSLRSILRELYLDECQGIDAMLMLPALLETEVLEVLSVGRIPTVCDDFVCALVSAHGCKMKELGLAHCTELTDVSLKVIGKNCTKLQTIDLTNLPKLKDVSIAHLASGCQRIQKIKLCRNKFSDEAIAAYLNICGESLIDLSLNNATQVSNHTAISLARTCRNLRRLDMSWCRNVTNEALGLIVDSCSLLELLKIFGCTQITKVFLDGHSNPLVEIVGVKMTSIVKRIAGPDFHVGPLRYSSSSS